MKIAPAWDSVEPQFVEMRVPLYSYGCEKKVKKALSHLRGTSFSSIEMYIYFEQSILQFSNYFEQSIYFEQSYFGIRLLVLDNLILNNLILNNLFHLILGSDCLFE